MPELFEFVYSQEFLFFVLVGLAAQCIDGTLGMAYGISANTLLLSMGVTPVQASASIHIAEVATSGISGVAHYGFGNVDLELVKKLIIPGVIGAVAGTLLLVWLPGDIIKAVVGLYLLVMGVTILFKAKWKSRTRKVRHHVTPLGFSGGFFDAAGGGGWGTIVASSLVAKGSVPRLAVGTVNVAEFFVALASSLVFILSLPEINWRITLGLALGGAIAAPFAAFFAKKIPAKPFMILIGCAIILLSAYTVYQVLIKMY